MQHLLVTAQAAGRTLGAGQVLPRVTGTLETQPSHGRPEPSLVAAASPAIKANACLAAELWRSLAGTKYVPRVAELSPDLLRLTFKNTVGVSVACTKQPQAF